MVSTAIAIRSWKVFFILRFCLIIDGKVTTFFRITQMVVRIFYVPHLDIFFVVNKRRYGKLLYLCTQ
jgi:uncharacterized metal-binding protein